MKRLESKDINWSGECTIAIVDKETNKIEVQTSGFVILNDAKFTAIGKYGYASIHHYQVLRDLSIGGGKNDKIQKTKR